MLYRLVHTQHASTQGGGLQITDIDSGLPNEEFGMYRKQPVYVPYNKKSFQVSNGMAVVVTDTSTPGFIDLVPSDKVKLSADRGVIKGLATAADPKITVVEIPTGALAAPTIATATFDDDGVAGDDDGTVEITGTNLLSYNPDTTTIAVTGYDPAGTLDTVILQHDGVDVIVTATSITITAAAHGFGILTDATVDAELGVTSVTVTANGQNVTAAVVPLV